MKLEEQFLELLFSSPNSEKIELIAKELEIGSNFTITKDIEKLRGICEL